MSSLVEKNHQIIVSPAAKPDRLDVFVSREKPELSRSQIQRYLEEGLLRVNQKQVKSSYKIRPGDVIDIEVPVPRELEAKAENIPLEILYQDKHLALVNKPAGMVVHASPGHADKTLVNALLYHLSDLSGIGGALRPGIVHRLDKDTSGIMLVAKNNESHSQLVRMFQNREIHKTYFALAYGNFKNDKGLIQNKLGRSRGDRKKISSRTARGKEATTSYQVRERFHHMALLEVSPLTGRTHQIRVHLAESGHPIVGDPVYGGKQWLGKLSKPLQDLLKQTNRQMLHAWKLEFVHPILHKKMKSEADLPEDFQEIIKLLRKSHA